MNDTREKKGGDQVVASFKIKPRELQKLKKKARSEGRTLSGHVKWLIEKDLHAEAA